MFHKAYNKARKHSSNPKIRGKEKSKSPEIVSKEMKAHNLLDHKFKIFTTIAANYLKKKMHEQDINNKTENF